jgi:2-oxoglutarate dehydrogenase E2 component (dihydrolipoamide succinyltransferase)
MSCASSLARTASKFAKRAEEGTLLLGEIKGGTFTITNGGVFGSLLGTPILNPPQVGILGLHKDRGAADCPERSSRHPADNVRRLSYDHRSSTASKQSNFW